MSARRNSRQDRRAQAKLQRQELARREVQALRDPVTEFENESDIASRPNRLRSGNRVLTLVLFLVLTLMLLLALALGVSVYRNLAVHNGEQDALREEVSLIANNIHMFDVQDAVSVRKGPEGKALVLSEDVDGQTFEMRFYQYRGNVVQEYLIGSAPFSPESASAVFASSVFDVQLKGSVVTIVTDAGISHVSLRSSQGGGRQ